MINNSNLNNENYKECIAQVMAIAKQREDLFERLKKALVNDDIDNIKLYAAKLCGLDSGRPHP